MDQLRKIFWNSSFHSEGGLEAPQDEQTQRWAMSLLWLYPKSVLEGAGMDLQRIHGWGHRIMQAEIIQDSLQYVNVLYWGAQPGRALSAGCHQCWQMAPRSLVLLAAALQAQPRMWSTPCKATALPPFKTALSELLEKQGLKCRSCIANAMLSYCKHYTV